MNIYSLLLTIGAVNGLFLVFLALRGRNNRSANYILAAVTACVVARLFVYIIGYAGAYDAWPWLTFLPLDWSLAFGPLIWLYVLCLTRSENRRPQVWHFAPLFVQVAYQAVCFCLPMPSKWDWFTTSDRTVVEPAFQTLGCIQLGAYLGLATRNYRDYTQWLEGHADKSQSESMHWLGHMLMAFAVYWSVALGFLIWQTFVRPLDYFQRFPLMICFCLLVYSLGLLGWRYGGQAYPAYGATPAQPPLKTQSNLVRVHRTDYKALAETWRDRVQVAGWWRDEDLTLARLAKRLAVSERTLSRGLNEGLGTTFNMFINHMRVRAVQTELDRGVTTDIIALAIDAGFASKASFNRAFKEFTGVSPSNYRRLSAQSQYPPIDAPGES